MHKENCFLTLTYDDEHLPKGEKLEKEEMQKFWKRLRKATGTKIRYYMAGEYGTEGGRPHYHACVFGWKPRDTVVWREKKDFKLFTSEFTNKIWGNGYVVVGDVTFDSAAYVARYVLKKLAGGGKQDQESPEYVAMSGNRESRKSGSRSIKTMSILTIS